VHQPARALTFFDVKGDIEDLLAPFNGNSLYYDTHTAAYYHPGRSARAVLDGTTVAQFGQIHPDVAAARKIKQEVFVAELFLDRLYQRDLRQVRYEALPRFPVVERDFSFLFPDGVEFEKIHRAVVGLGIAELRSIVPVEIFRGDYPADHIHAGIFTSAQLLSLPILIAGIALWFWRRQTAPVKPA